jgi:signal transduction histidine kinase
MPARLNLHITAPVFLGSVILLCVGVGSAWYLHRLQRDTSAVLAHNVAGAQVAQDLAISIREIRTRLNRYLLKGNQVELEMIPRYAEEAGDYLREAEGLVQTEREQQLLAGLERDHRRFSAQIQRMIHDVPSPALARQLEQLRDETLIKQILVPANEYLELYQAAVTEASVENQTIVQWMAFGLLLLGGCGGVAGLLAGYGIARGIRSRLVQLSVPVRDAAGKLNTVVGPVLVSVGQSFEEMREGLERMASQVEVVVARLQQSQQQALRAEQFAAVGQLAAGMAHELRNPLTVMKVLVQSGLERVDWDLLDQSDLTILEEEITRMEKLIQTFLDFARPPRLERQVVDLRESVSSTVEVLRPRADQLGVTIQCTQPDVPLLATVDQSQIRQLLLNLLLNALDAVPSGGNVWVTSRPEPNANADAGPPGLAEHVAVEVADNGCGLPNDLGEKIFDPFISTKVTGIGLGLSISRQIVEAHGGTITAQERLGGGAWFTVRLPGVGAETALPAYPEK